MKITVGAISRMPYRISYYRTEDYDNAKETFAKVIDNFPGTNSASQSETYLAEINNMEQ